MAFSRLTRWLRRTHPNPREIRPTGNEFGWVLREVSGEARHPNRTTTPKQPVPDNDRPTPR